MSVPELQDELAKSRVREADLETMLKQLKSTLQKEIERRVQEPASIGVKSGTPSVAQASTPTGLPTGAAEVNGSWSARAWLASLGLGHAVVHDAVSAILPAGSDAFQFLQATCTREQMDEQLAAAELSGLGDAIWSGVMMLRTQTAATGLALNAKFAEEKKFDMAYGSSGDYFVGELSPYMAW